MSATTMDPFSCFGSDDDAEEDEEGESILGNDDDEHTTLQMKQHSRNLIDRSNAAMYSNDATHPPPAFLHSPNYKVVDIENAGKGLCALKAFRVGDEVLREFAAMRIPNQQAATTQEEADRMHGSAVQRAFDNLHPTTRRDMLQLSSCEEAPEDMTPVGIYQTNSYRLGDNEPYGGLFLTTARMNHSCRPNCHHFWRADLKQQLVFAARDIAIGEELTTTYGPPLCFDTAERRAYLMERFSFLCQCEMCRQGNLDGDDDRMMKMDAMREDISLYAASGNPDAAMQAVEQCLALLREQRLDTPALMKPILHSGYQIAMGKLGDKALARSYLVRELAAVQHSEGADSPRAIEVQRIINGIVLDTTSIPKQAADSYTA